MVNATRSVTSRKPADVVGAGRYILSFLLAGFIGLGVQYVLREKGWLATWINAGIFIILIVVLVAVAASGAGAECFQTADGRIICP